MHPIEQLRYVARASGADATLLVEEAASALRVFHHDPLALLAGAKSLLARQPAVGPLWWMASKLVADPDPAHAVRQVIDDLRSDPTADELVDAIPDGHRVLLVGWPDTVVRAVARRPDLVVLVIDIEGQGHGVVRRLDRVDVEAEAVDPAYLSGAMEESDLVLLEAGAVGERLAIADVGAMSAAAVARVTATPTWLVAGVGRRLPEAYVQEILARITEPDLPAFTASWESISLELVGRHFGPPLDCPMLPELLRPVR